MKRRANWRELLAGAVGDEPRALVCRRAKLSATYLRDVFERNVTPSIDKAERLSDALGVSLTEWFLEPETAASRTQRVLEIAATPSLLSRDVPVFGAAQGGDDGAFILNNGEVIDYVRRPERLAGLRDAFALYVVGNSMSPWREPGQIVYVLPKQPVRIGDYVVIQLKPDHPGATPRAYIKRLMKSNEREVVVEQFQPHKTIIFARKEVHTIDRVLDWSELLGV